MDIVFTDNGSGWYDIRLVEYRDDCQMHSLKFIGKVRLNKNEVQNMKIDNHIGDLGVSFEDFDEYNYKGHIFNKLKIIINNYILNENEKNNTNLVIDKIDWSHSDNYIQFYFSNCGYNTDKIITNIANELKKEYPFIFNNFDVNINISQNNSIYKIIYNITIKKLY